MSLLLITRHAHVAIVRLNRPQARNALSKALVDELLQALVTIDNDPGVGAIILTGTDAYFCGKQIFRVIEWYFISPTLRLFKAGADIKELKELDLVNAYMGNFLQNLNSIIASLRKPLIGVVNGFAVSNPTSYSKRFTADRSCFTSVGRGLRVGHDVRHAVCCT
jgi:enoyl-CoA hydratase/carnithine racemase